MKVTYDKTVDAVYIELTKARPDGVIEVAEGINIDVTSDGQVTGIELLDATRKVPLEALLTYEIGVESISEWIGTKKDLEEPAEL
jgi:uncharacterized protein YuzE